MAGSFPLGTGRERLWVHPSDSRLMGSIRHLRGSAPASVFPARRDGERGWELPPLPWASPGEGRAQPSLCLQVTPFPEPYRDTLHPYKISEQDTDVRATPVPSLCPLSPQAEL